MEKSWKEIDQGTLGIYIRNLQPKNNTQTNKQTKEVLGTLGMKIIHYCKDHSLFITTRFY